MISKFKWEDINPMESKNKSYKLSLHVFRRDLRLEDNAALIDALKYSEKVMPIFIFDKRQIDQNDYRGDSCVQFMLDSLRDLKKQLKNRQGKLYFFYGLPEKIIGKLIQELSVDAVFVNRDYTPFSIKRDKSIQAVCKKLKVDFYECADALLHEPEDVLKSNGEPYVVYTAFMKKSRNLKVSEPQKNNFKNFFKGSIDFALKKPFDKIKYEKNKNLLQKGGRKEGRKLLLKIKKLKNYKKDRDYPSKGETTLLSAHNKFGTISIREFYFSVKKYFNIHHALIDELYWRDFFSHIGFYFPYVFGKSFYKKYDRLTWRTSKKHFEYWCEGKTGFPIIDAGMRELNETGYMHNRVRMLVASFLTKDLHIDWRWGERYFARKLTDYDPAVNNGNWQWVASTGCDAQPYFRIFNPWLQQKKFDAKCIYIKKWIPELKSLSAKEIHSLENTSLSKINYPKPIVNHKEESKKAISLYKKIAKSS